MLELGKYAAPIYLAYGATFTLLFGIIIISVIQSTSTQKYLKNLKKKILNLSIKNYQIIAKN